jgi:hypothetical protein
MGSILSSLHERANNLFRSSRGLRSSALDSWCKQACNTFETLKEGSLQCPYNARIRLEIQVLPV